MALLAILYEFFIAFAFAPPPKPHFSPSERSAILAQIAGALARQRSVYLNHLLVGSVIALAIVALVSGAAWLGDGRSGASTVADDYRDHRADLGNEPARAPRDARPAG